MESIQQFAGAIKMDRVAAWGDDEGRWADIENMCPKSDALVYWTDGSLKGKKMGASVVWPHDRSPGRWSYQGFHILSPNKSLHSAEMFAVAAALRIATKKAQDHANIKVVRVYTDALTLLQQLSSGLQHNLGPEMEENPAMQVIYEQTAWLTEQGIQVGLAWVKGHARSEGNEAADTIAGFAANSEYEEFSGEDWDIYTGTPITPMYQARPIADKNTLHYEEMWTAVCDEAERRDGKQWDKTIYNKILKIKKDLEDQEDDVDELEAKFNGLDDQVDTRASADAASKSSWGG